MKNIFLAILLYYSFTVSAQAPERCELSYDTVGYCIDGKAVIDYKYKQGSEFIGDAASVTNYQDKCALINTSGKEITPFIYDRLVPCNNFLGLFACRLGNNVGIINSKGEEVIPIKYQVDNFEYDFMVDGNMAYFDSSYLFVFSQNGKKGILNSMGKPLSEFIYNNIWIDFQWIDNAKKLKPIIVQKKDKIKIMHKDGSIDKRYEYDAFLGFWGHDCVLRKGKKIEFLNGETWNIVQKHYDKDYEISEKLYIVVEDEKKGLIDTNGKVLIPIIYKDVNIISKSDEIETWCIGVKINDKWGVYNGNNQELIPVLYEEISFICIGATKMLKVKQNGKWAMFDRSKKISEFKYDDIYCETLNSAHIEIGEQKGELFFDGKEVWK